MATVKFPSEMPAASDVGGNDKLMISKDGSGEAFQVSFNAVKEYLEITDIELSPVQGGATEAVATPLPSAPAGQNRKMDASPGWYSVNGVPVEATSGHVWKWFWNGTTWSLVDMGELPATPTSDEVTPTGQLAVSQKGAYDYTKPLFDLTTESANLSDNIFQLGAWNADTGSPVTTNSVKRLATTFTITQDMVGQHWINGRGILSSAYAYVIVRTSVSNPPVISLRGRDSNDDLSPLTFTITESMIGMLLRLSPGSIGAEPPEGYENTFTWNMGVQPMPEFIPKGGVVIDGKKVSGVALEVSNNEKVVRAKKATKKTYVGGIEGNEGGNGSGFYIYDTGALSPSSQRKIITFPVNFSLKYALSGMVNGAIQVADAVYFDSEMNYLGYNERIQSGDVVLDRKALTFPVGASGNGFIGTGNRNQYDYPVLEQYTEEDIGWDAGVFESDLEVKEDFIVKIKGKKIASTESPLLGKILAKLGDSIMRAGGQFSSPGFAEQIATKYNMDIVEYSQGGATITYNGNGTNDIVRQVDALVASGIKPDYILLNGQTNDINIGSIQLGDISEMFDAPLTTTHFTGALEYICKTLKTNFPEAKILYVRVHKMASRPFDKQESFGQRAVEVLNKWCVPIADIYNNGGLNSYLPEMRDKFTIPSTGDPTIGDRTHPNTLGYTKFYTPIVESLLNTI